MLFRLFLAGIFLCSCSTQRMTQTDLYFGQLKLNGDSVSEKEWHVFAEQYVSKVFPQGSTVVTTGYWYDTAQHKLITGPSRMSYW